MYSTTLEALPEDVVRSTKLRVLDAVGLAVLGAGTEFGSSVRKAALAMSAPGPCHVLGTGEPATVAAAAFANGAVASAWEFDDFHIESLGHLSGPAVTAGLALSETVPLTGSGLITAIAVGNEIACRIGSVAGREFHRKGMGPTSLIAPFGVTYLAGKVLGLSIDEVVSAAGICGDLAAGLLPWAVDRTHSKPLASGWAAHSGIAAGFLAWAGNTGPTEVFEGRTGFFASHVQDASAQLDFGRIANDLGDRWESRNSIFKPYAAADAIQPYIRALLRLRARAGIQPDDMERMECPVAPSLVPIVAEPREDRCAPASSSQARTSLPYSVAEAFYRNSLGSYAYSQDSLRNPEILDLARRVTCYADVSPAGPGSLKGSVRMLLKDGRVLEEKEEYAGPIESAMTEAELLAKFYENVAILPAAAREKLAEQILNLDREPDASTVIPLTVAPDQRRS